MDLGAVPALLSWRWSSAEALAAARSVQPRAVVADQAMAASLGAAVRASVGGRPAHCLQLGEEAIEDGWVGAEALLQGRLQARGPAPRLACLHGPNGAAAICFTSGTTGAPKGAVLSHAALHAQATAKMAAVGYCREDIYLHCAPLFHVGGLSAATAVLTAGGCQVGRPKGACQAIW